MKEGYPRWITRRRFPIGAGAALAGAARLRQSILKRAFEGRLVPQDPSDEPASALLARIRAERRDEEEENQAAR